MRIASIGGGPAGLYFSILMKQAFPASEITVYERNKPDDTFGFGVVFSDETLGGFESADPESFAEIKKSFAYWGDIETYYGDTCVRSTGHGFCGLSRKRLLEIFHARCKALGVRLDFQREIKDDAELAGHDLVLAADGINSFVRTKYAAHFQPSFDWRKAKFCWLGTTKPLSAFTFVFRETQWGLFQVHAYPFEKNLSTWIVECDESVWRKAGLDRMSEEQTVAFCERIFADDLAGHRLLGNRSIWRTFPTIRCERWHHGNVVLMGDAVHTAHFSIGSGTKLAMEDAMALVAAFRARGTRDVPAVLAAYEESRRVETIRLQRVAQTSLEWFENSARYMGQHPLQFTFNLMTRSKRITWDNLAKRDPELVRRVGEWYAGENGLARTNEGDTPPPLFAPLKLRELVLGNRMVVSPMCQYSATNGTPDDWHLVHLGSRAMGGAGLVIAEATGVTADGRISPGCTGIYTDEHVAAWKRIVDFVHTHAKTRIGLQIGHAGRKASCSRPWEGDSPLRGAQAWPTIGPSALPFAPGWHVPKEMDRAERQRIAEAFVAAAERAERAGFDALELHMAHGYLLSSFLSPKSNQRRDEYGGSLENRMRFPLEILEAVRAVWPKSKPLFVRISASDWLDDAGGWTVAESVVFARELKARGCDLVDVSSGGNTPESRIVYGRMYQVPFAEQIRAEARVPVMAVGGIAGADHANTILAAGRADLVAIARGFLSDPYLVRRAAEQYGHTGFPWPNQYLAVKPRKRVAREE